MSSLVLPFGMGREIQGLDSKAARWIAADAIKELESEAVQTRLMKAAGTRDVSQEQG